MENDNKEREIDLNIILLGPPGSGKGTQATAIEERFNLFHLSTGEMFREAVRQDTDLGKQVAEIMQKGELVPDDILYRLVKEKVAELSKKGYGILFDGYPRTLVQAEQLDLIMESQESRIHIVLLIEVDEEALIKRLSGRLYCSKCEITYNRYFHPPKHDNTCDVCGSELTQRSEDYPEAIRTRLDIYRERTLPLIEYYEKQGKLHEIAGDRKPEEVSHQIAAIIKKKLNQVVSD